MGVKQTKCDDALQTPKPNQEAIITNDINFDPRSPMDARTPITLIQPTAIDRQEKFVGLRKRLLKGFTYNLNDPRSPNTTINRTPLIFDEKIDRTLNLNDTFSDLFVNTNAVPPQTTTSSRQQEETVALDNIELDEFNANTSIQNNIQDVSAINIFNNDSSIEFDSFCDDETMPCTTNLQIQLPQVEAKDPRSPSIDIERTPLIFEDDIDNNVTGEDEMLETILATLSLDTSGLSANSIVSFNTSPKIKQNDADKELVKPTNKHLDRARGCHKRTAISKKITKNTSTRRQHIYEDAENEIVTMTPNKKLKIVDSPNARTPLSCVRNRTHLRSRSVEASAKSIKKRMQLSSYDDTLNPIQSIHVNALQNYDDF